MIALSQKRLLQNCQLRPRLAYCLASRSVLTNHHHLRPLASDCLIFSLTRDVFPSRLFFSFHINVFVFSIPSNRYPYVRKEFLKFKKVKSPLFLKFIVSVYLLFPVQTRSVIRQQWCNVNKLSAFVAMVLFSISWGGHSPLHVSR